MKRLLPSWLSLDGSAWPITAIALLLVQTFFAVLPVPEASVPRHIFVDYSPLLMAATAIAILSAVTAVRNAILFWTFLASAIGLWLVDLSLWVRFRVEFPSGFRLLAALTALALLTFLFFAEVLRRKQVERAQQESQERLRLAAEAGKVYAYEWDVIRDAIVRSPECKEVLGDIADSVGDTFDRMSARIDPEDRERFACAIQNLNPKNARYQISYRLVRPDGSVMWLEESARAFFDSKGRVRRLVGMVSDVTARKRAERELADLSARFVTAQEQERTRIARELHDDVSQRLALIAVALEDLGENPPRTKAEIGAALHDMWHRISEISSEIHHLSRQLHPSTLGLGLGAALRTLCNGVERQQGLKVTITCDNVPDALPGDVALCLYRVAQEAISNVAKHSQVKVARLELSGAGDFLQLQINDHGKGFEYDAARECGLGLLSMRERLRLVDGTLKIRSGPHGTEVLARVPVKQEVLKAAASNRG
jgi:PAS domain S-box-containing protein